MTQDGIQLEDFRDKGRKDLLKYPSIPIKTDRVLSIEKSEECSFEITVKPGENITTKNVVLAAGLKEKLLDTTDSLGRTNVKGIYAAGEITGPSQLIVSASQGDMAGLGIIRDSSEAAFAGI